MVHELVPAPTPVLVVLCLLVAMTSYATLVEIVGRVGGIHYPGASPGEQVTLVVILEVVLLPVDAVAVRNSIYIYYGSFIVITLASTWL